MTEDDAEKTLCHRSFEPETLKVGSGGSRTVIHSRFTMKCIGSACAAWRWEIGDPKAKESKGGILLPRNLWPGYCGLAGKP